MATENYSRKETWSHIRKGLKPKPKEFGHYSLGENSKITIVIVVLVKNCFSKTTKGV